ncbi:MAG: type II secretory pathway component PulF [Mariniblastus sp.]|jgi:type II secretory pathway component PulF
MEANDFERFHRALKAAAFAGVPLNIGDASSDRESATSTLDRLEQLGATVGPLVANSKGNFDAASAAADLPKRYQAALQIFAGTDSMLPVLEGLSIESRSTQMLARSIRWTMIYLFIVLAFSFLGLLFFSKNVVPSILNLRADLTLAAAISPSTQFDPIPWLPIIIGLFGVLAIGLLSWLLLFGFQRTAILLGGSKFVRSKVLETTANNVAMLLKVGHSPKSAAEIGCRLAGVDATVQQEIVEAIEGPENLIQLATLSEFSKLLGQRRLAFFQLGTPIILVSLVGGVVVLVYSAMIYWPIVALLKDLVTAGVGA